MAALIFASMIGLKLFVMRHMYHNRGKNLIVWLIAMTVGITSWTGIRQSCTQILRSQRSEIDLMQEIPRQSN